LSCLEDDVRSELGRFTPYFRMKVEPLALVPYFPPGSADGPVVLRDSLGGSRAALLRNHGTIAAAPTLLEAANVAEEIERLREIVISSAADSRQLPTERELCRQLGISRTALREHLQALEVVGLLRRDQGRGTFLQSPDGIALGNLLDLAMVADDVRPDDLMYVRRVLERESAALATGHLSPEIHARMTGLCAQMRAPLPAQLIAAADHEFHMLLLQCSGNAALRLLGATLSQSLHRSMLGMREFLASDRRAQLDMAHAHERVLEAVVHGDSQRAWKEILDGSGVISAEVGDQDRGRLPGGDQGAFGEVPVEPFARRR
jgi:GntR family transcriptional repressor for pyruvate dehydrogenase complex